MGWRAVLSLVTAGRATLLVAGAALGVGAYGFVATLTPYRSDRVPQPLPAIQAAITNPSRVSASTEDVPPATAAQVPEESTSTPVPRAALVAAPTPVPNAPAVPPVEAASGDEGVAPAPPPPENRPGIGPVVIDPPPATPPAPTRSPNNTPPAEDPTPTPTPTPTPAPPEPPSQGDNAEKGKGKDKDKDKGSKPAGDGEAPGKRKHNGHDKGEKVGHDDDNGKAGEQGNSGSSTKNDGDNGKGKKK